MAFESIDIYFNSGGARQLNYDEDSNISAVEISNSDNQYYQNGIVTVFNVPSTQSIGDSVMIKINDILQFNGYVQSKQQTIDGGKILDNYTLIGKTFDLWRYNTGLNVTFKDKKSAYIASSLVSSYCTNISGGGIDPAVGVTIDSIDLSDMSVGEAISRLSEMDGYTFYVDTSDDVQYYFRNTGVNMFIVTEDDIIEMVPVDESDENLVNDVVVIGPTNYYYKTEQNLHCSSAVVLDGDTGYNRYYAQKFKATYDRLSGFRAYLGRTKDPNQPTALNFEIWENTERLLFEDDFDNWNYLNSGNSEHYNMEINNSNLELKPDTSLAYDPSKYFGISNPSIGGPINYICQMIRLGNNFIPNGIKMRLYVDGPESGWTVKMEIQATGATGFPNGEVLAASNWKPTKYGNRWLTGNFSFSSQVFLDANVTYGLVVRTDNNAECDLTYYCRDGLVATTRKMGYSIVSTEPSGSDWSGYSYSGNYVLNYYNGYPTTGQIESLCYSGNSRETGYYDTQYMKIDLTDVVSSNRIYISGSIDSGATWKTLTDGQYTNFETSDNSPMVKYKFSSNGAYTPKIGKAVVNITDDSAGLDYVVFEEKFDDFTKLSSQSVHGNYFGVNRPGFIGSLTFSGVKTKVFDSTTNGGGYGTGDYPSSNMFDGNLSTYARENTPKNTTENFYPSGLYSGSPNTIGYYTKVYNKDLNIDVMELKVSGADADYTEMTNCVVDPPNNATTEYYQIFTRQGFSGSKRLRWRWRQKNNTSNTKYSLCYELLPITMPSSGFSSNASYIKTKNYQIYFNGKYMTADYTVSNPSYVTVSGTTNSGTNWTKLEDGEKTQITNFGKHVQLMYCIKPSGTVGLLGGAVANPYGYYIPSLDDVTLTVSEVQGGGIPKSGTVVDLSDSISITSTEVAYPPSYSSWQTWSKPALELMENKYYWFIMYNASGSSAYWDYYYDQNSTYDDGYMAQSWDNGVNWSSNATDSAHVPAGDMCFNLGWKNDVIRATATNQDSIDEFGKYFRRIDDNDMDTLDKAQALADATVSGSNKINKKGNLTIDGRTDMSVEYRFSANLSNFDINETWNVVEYTQRWTPDEGFVTLITYNEHLFDIAREVAVIKEKMAD